MRAVTLPALLLCLCLCLPFKGVGAFEVLVWLHAECGCSYFVPEQSGSLEVCAEILFINGTATTTATYTVTMSTVEGTATSGVDYDPLSSFSFSFAEGSSQGDQQCTTISITDDIAVENTETFRVELSTSDAEVGLSLCPSAPVHITDTDVITVDVTEQTMEVNQVEPLGGPRTAEVCLNISHGSLERTVFCTYGTRSGSATDSRFTFSDYQFLSGFVTFTSGLSMGDMQCVSVSIFEDIRVENDEDFFVDFGNRNGITVNPSASSARITILNDDVAVIGMTSPNLSQTEDSIDVSVCVTLLQSQLEITLTAFIETQGVTATGGNDYNEISNFGISFFSRDLPGTERCTNIRINEDTILEYNETFDIVLSEDSARLEIESGRNITKITILEDNDDISIGFQSLLFSTTEGVSVNVTVCAQIDEGTLERNVPFYLSTANLTATEDRDYVRVTSRELTFLPGQSSSNMPTSCTELEILDDIVLEDRETFSVVITSRLTEVIITSGREEAQVQIDEDDDDSITIGFPLGQVLTVMEGNEGAISVCPEILQGVLERDVSVFASTSDITAIATRDYTPIVLGEIIFTSGQVTGDARCISVPILDDNNILEMEVENFGVTLTAVDLVVDFIVGQDNSTVNINEDTMDSVTIGLQGTSYATTETAGPFSVCAQMFNGNLEREVSMTLVSSDGTAVAPGDYEVLNTQLVFAIGSSTGAVVCADLQVIDDNVIEEDEESLTLTMSADDPPVTVTTVLVAAVTIRENDNDVTDSIALTSNNYDAFESNGGVNVCAVIAAMALERSLTVLLSSQDGTARNGADYTSFQLEALTFISGAQAGDQLCHFVPVIDDDILEGSESFSVTLSSFEPAFLGSGSTQATVTINPDPADIVELAFQSNAYSGTEQPSLRDVTICVEITMGILERDVVVNVTTTSGTAESGTDYTGPTPSELTFRGGLSTGDERCIVVSVVDDNFIEDEETFDISLTVPPADAASVIFNGADVTTFTIIQDPNDRAVVQLQRETISEMEGQNISVCTVLSSIAGEVQRPLLVNVTVTSAIAEIGVDFDILGPAAVTFSPNSVSGAVECITIELLTDRFLEVPENFVTNLNTNDPAVTVDLTADLTIITIIDVPDPNAVGVTFTSLDFAVTEGDPLVEVCVEIVTGTVNEEDTVQVETMSGTATADRDFTFLIGSVRFFPGETVGAFECVSINIINDNIVEDDETFAVSLTSTGMLQAVGNTTANVTIFQDSDTVVLGLQVPDLTVVENDTFSVCIQITAGSLERDVFIGVEAENSSSAEVGIDFIGPDPSVLTFTAGQSEGDIQCAEVSILDDSVLDGERNFSIRLVETSGGDGGGGGVQIDVNVPSIDIRIGQDLDDPITVRLSQLMYQVTEGPLLGPSSELMICVTIDFGSLGRDVSVNLVTPITGSSVIATPFLDFIPIAEAVTFTEGQTVGDSVCAIVTIVSDIFVETEETFEVSLLPDPEDMFTAVITPGMGMATIIITDGEENSRVEIQPAVSSVLTTEGDSSSSSTGQSNGAAAVEVCLELASGNLQRNVTVNVKSVSSPTPSATVTEDYLYLNINITFTSGQNATGDNQQCFSVTILNDDILECNETFDISISPIPEDEDVVNITRQLLTVLIEEDANDFVEIRLLPVEFLVSENETFQVCAELSVGSVECDVSVSLDAQLGSAIEGIDFMRPDPPALTFTPGQSVGDIQCANVTVVDDSTPQPARRITVAIGNTRTVGGIGRVENVRVNPAVSSVSFDIDTDINDLLHVNLSQLIYRAVEGLSEVSVCVRIKQGFASSATTVQVATTLTSTATPVLDFIPILQILTFKMGQTIDDTVCAPITIVEDMFVEDIETFEVILLPTPTDLFKVLIVPGEGSAIVTISDGESGRSVEVKPSSSKVTATEGVGPTGGLRRRSVGGGGDCAEVMVCLELVSGNLQRNVSVTVQTVSSPTTTAIAGVDYVSFERNVTFTSGQNATDDNQQCVFIPLLDDDVVEGNQTFDILITAAPGDEDVVIINSTDEMITVIIQDDPNDNVQIGLTNTRFTLTEAVDSSILLCAELQAGSLERNVSVAVMTEGSNATAGVDFLIEPDVLTFTSGQSAFDGLIRCANITILDDEDTEPRESLMIFLVPTEGDATAVVIPPISFMSSINILEDPSDEVQISPLTSVETVTEGGTATVCIGVSLGSLQTVVQVNVRTINNVASTATPGEDFSILMETVTLDSNEPVCNSISILNDDILEGCEAFFVDIEVQAAFSGIAVVPNDVNKMIILIEDDLRDGIVVGLSQSAFMAFEVDGFVTVCIELLEGRLERDVSVLLETIEGSAAPSDDYIPLLDQFTFTSGVQPGTLSCLNITIIDENVVESPESFSVVILQSSPGVSINSSRATSIVEIIDDEFNIGSASQSNRAVAIAVPIVVILIVAAIAVVVIISAYLVLKSRKNKKEAGPMDVVTVENLQASESKEEVPVVIDSKAAEPDETTAL